MINLLWLQSGCCGGSTISFLNAEQPDILTTFRMLNVNLSWHPSLSPEMGEAVIEIFNQFVSKKKKLDVLIVEGAIYHGPNKTGKYFMFHGRPFKEWILDLAKVAHYTMATGTCASFGGIAASGTNPMDATGLQFMREEKGGLLGADYTSQASFPVINIAGCPAHPDWIVESLTSIVLGKLDITELDKYNRPKIFYSKLAHHACPRNEYYEFKASAEEYSQQGCLFENLGCKATQCESDCNERLWLGRTGSCTRGGFPCISCTSPKFPDGFLPFFETEKIGDIPTTLPLDVPKAWYVGMSGLAKLACPKRLRVNAVSFRKIDIE
ncbi:MAG TPA: HupU protein [bacterium (Candidatus Stahlbacteria)]|nr:HupU protein [Candidatus Stahlbacteria bacterium]